MCIYIQVVPKQFELMKHSMNEPLLSIWTSLLSLIGSGIQFEKEQDVSESKHGCYCFNLYHV